MSAFDAIYPTVKLGDSLSTLAADSSVHADQLSLRISPELSTARLTRHYGRISSAPAPFASVASSALAGKYCQILIGSTIQFTGVISNTGVAVGGTYQPTRGDSVPQGDEKLVASSLDYLLDRVPINKSAVGTYGDVTALYVFNGEGGEIKKNRTASKDGNAHKFEFDGSVAEEWTALDILEYLLEEFADESGLSWSLNPDSDESQHAYLANIVPQSANPAGKTLRQMINELIRPDLGFAYLVELDDSSNPMITVVSLSDQAITLDEETILPANPNLKDLTSSVEEAIYMGGVEINRVEQSAYSTVRVFSEPVRVMATFKLGTDSGGMSADWSSALETAYKAAADYERRDDEYDPVYAEFKLTSSFDKLDYAGTAIVPVVDESTLDVTFSTDNNFVAPAHPFDRVLPIKVNEDDANSDYLRPFLLVKDDSGNYHISDKITYDGQKAASIGLKLMDDKSGIRAVCPYQHILAKNESGITSEFAALYDYNDCLFTGSFHSDAVLAYSITGASLPGGATRTKNIYLPGFNLWVGLSGTYTDRNTTLSAATTYRDDRAALKKLAKIASAWYGRIRNTVTYSKRKIESFQYLGDMIVQVYSGGSFTPSGTVISAVDFDFLGQNYTVSTDFFDLDFARLSRRSVASSKKQTFRRISAIEEKIRNVSVREAKGGNPGDDFGNYFKPSNTSSGGTSKVTIAAGKVVVGGTVFDVAEQEFTITAETWITVNVTYSGGYAAALAANTGSYPVPVAGTAWKRVVCHVEYSGGAITAINRRVVGPIHYEG